MEQSYEAQAENLGRRKKPKSSNYSEKFLSLPCEIVALRFLRICFVITQPLTLPTRREKLNLDPPFPSSHGSFFKMIVIYAIVSRDVLLKHLRCRIFRVKISGFTDFSDPVQGTNKGRKLYFFCVSFIKHLRLNRTGMRSDKHSPHARLSQVDPYLHDFSTVCFSRFSLPLINQRSKFEFQMLKTFLFHILHITQSRVSMGLTVSRKSVKKTSCWA